MASNADGAAPLAAPPPAAPAPASAPPSHGPPPSGPPSHRGSASVDASRFRLPQRYTLDFGRLDKDYFIRDIRVDIDNQETLATATYHALEQQTQMDLPINLENFIRMWKTLILKRVQDVYENEKCQRAENFVRLIRNITMPAPLADLLYSLGACLDPTSGVLYHITPPARPAQPQPWWNVDPAILANWILTMNRMQHLFTMKEFPSIREYDGRPLMLTAIQDRLDGTRIVKAFSNQPTPADGFIRFVNDELFENGIAYNDCHLRLTDPLDLVGFRFDYLRDYCIHSNT